MNPNAEIMMTISSYSGGNVSIYPQGFGHPSETFKFTSFEDVLEEITNWWAEREASVHAVVITKMALAIIKYTYETGQCTDSALRLEFSDYDVETFGARAIEMANTMATNGPFTITKTDLANAA